MNDAFTAELALTIVRDHGLVSTWQLNVIAAAAHRYGRPEAAAAILQVADAVKTGFRTTDTGKPD